MQLDSLIVSTSCSFCCHCEPDVLVLSTRHTMHTQPAFHDFDPTDCAQALGCIAFSGEQRRRLRWPEQLPLSNLEETVFAKGSSTQPLIAPWALLRNAIGATGSSVGNRMAVHIVEVILQSTLALHFVRGFVGGSWHGDL